MNNEAKEVFLLIKNNIESYSRNLDIASFSIFCIIFPIISFFSLVVLLNFFSQKNNTFLDSFILIISFASFVFFLTAFIVAFTELQLFTKNNYKNMFFIVKISLKSFFFKNKNIPNTLYANFLYNIFSQNENIYLNLSIIKGNNSTSFYINNNIVYSTLFSYINKNYKKLNKNELEEVILTIKPIIENDIIKYNDDLYVDRKEFNEFFITIKKYQDNRTIREFAKKLSYF